MQIPRDIFIKHYGFSLLKQYFSPADVQLLIRMSRPQSQSPPHGIQDSLDNLSLLQGNKHRQLVAQVKQAFAQELQKLQSSETRQIGLTELRRLVEQYREPEHLRSYLAILKNLKSNSNSTTKEHQILVVSILAQTYQDKLLDPLDKPPSLLKSCLRLVQILHSYFGDRSPTVQQACARALLDVATYCLQSQPIDTIFSMIYSPLISILKSGVDKGSQATAAVCLNQIILYNRKVNNHEMLQRLAPDMLTVILKVNCEYHELFQAVASMLEARQLSFLEGRIVNFLAKLMPVIGGLRDSAPTSNFNSYMCKVGVCRIVQKIGSLLPISQKEKLRDLNVIQSLQQAARHRIIQVQMAAARAIKSWRQERDDSPKSKGLASLEQKRNNKKMERSKSKEDRQKLQNELTFMKEDLQKLVKGGWGANNRAKNYVKRGTGVGGGSHGKVETSPNNHSNSKSHKEHLEELREYIKKGVKQNKQLDKFAQFTQPQRNKSPPKTANAKNIQSIALNNNNPGQDQVGLQVEEGDQMVYDPRGSKPNKFNSRPKNDRVQDIQISEEQAKQLRRQEQNLMEQGREMNVNFNTTYSEDGKNNNNIEPKNEYSRKHSKAESEQPKNNNGLVPFSKHQAQKKTSILENLERQKQFNGHMSNNQIHHDFLLSQQQLGEMVEEYNLSQVSSNLNDVLSQSDMHMLQSSKAEIAMEVIEPVKGKSSIESLKEMINQKKTRISALSKFMKKDSFQQPQETTPRPVTIIHPQIQTATPLPQHNNSASLNFTESLESRSRSAIPSQQRNQFTLNPKERFSSVKQPLVEDHGKQIQQQIALSCYEDSVPHQQQLPVYTPNTKTVPQQAKRKETLPEEKVDYQKIIKNPPKSVIGQRSKIKQIQKLQVPMSQFSQEQQLSPDIKASWLKIIDLLARDEVNLAFESALQLDDPIYLLRLMLISKCPLKKLTANTTNHLWRNFLQIYSHRFIDVLAVSLFSQAHQLALLPKCLSMEQLQQVLLGLFQLSGTSKGKLSYRAASLYNDIEAGLRPQ